MYSVALFLHSWLRWIIVILLLLNIIRHIAAYSKPFNATDKRLGLLLLISAHLTFLIGLYQWIAGTYGVKAIQNNGMSEVMRNGTERFFAVEHAFGMLIAIILITIGRGVAKKAIPDNKKHIRTLIFFLLAFVIILALIPWPGMQEASRPLFRS